MKKTINIFKTKRFISLNFELLIWIAALLILAMMNPAKNHISICPLSLLNFEYCLGCGLGHSITYLFHGNFEASFNTHPLGSLAIVILSYRIISLIIKNFVTQKTTTL